MNSPRSTAAQQVHRCIDAAYEQASQHLVSDTVLYPKAERYHRPEQVVDVGGTPFIKFRSNKTSTIAAGMMSPPKRSSTGCL